MRQKVRVGHRYLVSISLRHNAIGQLLRLTSPLVLLLVLASQVSIFANNWPNWRGPTRNGVSTEAVPVEWDADKNVVWKLEMPDWTGSTPAIWEESIFLNVAAGDNLELWCLDRNTGQPVWKRFLSDGNHRQRKQNMSSPSPIWPIIGKN